MKYLYLLLPFLIIASCSKKPPVDNPVLTTEGEMVFVINEGTYTWGNGSISAYFPEKDSVVQEVYKAANNLPLGDVPQTMLVLGDYAYISVNNSGHLLAVDFPSFELATEVSLNSPRYLAAANNQLYVTDLHSTEIAVFALPELVPETNIDAGKTTEAILATENYLIVSNWSFGNTIQFYDLITNDLVNELELTLEPNSMVLDKNENLWVLCAGGFQNEEIPSLYRINVKTQTVEHTFTFESKSSSPTRLCSNAAMDTLYYLSNGVFQMPISNSNLPQSTLIKADNRNLYGLGISPTTGNIYVSDARDFVSIGTVSVYNNIGNLISQFDAGIGCGGFCFYDE